MNANIINTGIGKKAADFYIKGGKLINVYSGEIYPANVAICQDKIAYVGLQDHMVGAGTQVICAKDYYLAPGYIEPHAHPWAIYSPLSLMEATIPLGTTVTVNDNLFFYLNLGLDGFKKFIDKTASWPMRYYWSARAFPQSPLAHEDEVFSIEKVTELLHMEEILAIAEITRWPSLLANQGQVWEKIRQATALGKKVEGHTAGASYDKLNPLVASGLSCCHEAITPQQVQDQLRLGLWVMLRHSSLRPDLPELVKAIIEMNLDHRRMMLTTDGPSPVFAHKLNWLPGMLKILVDNGVSPVTALQMATINPATFYGMDRLHGGIAPGRRADILFLSAPDQFIPAKVIAGGRLAAEDGKWLRPMPELNWQSVGFPNNFNPNLKLANPDLFKISTNQSGKEELVPVIEMLNAVITKSTDLRVPVKNGSLDPTHIPELMTICLIDRAGKWITRGFIKGFAAHIQGLAATYSTSGHLVVIGKDPVAMAQAAQQVIDWDGGIALVEDGELLHGIALPLGGLISPLPFRGILPLLKNLEEAVIARGYPFNDLLYSLLFFSCDFLPGLRLTANGLLQVKDNTIIRASETLRN